MGFSLDWEEEKEVTNSRIDQGNNIDRVIQELLSSGLLSSVLSKIEL